MKKRNDDIRLECVNWDEEQPATMDVNLKVDKEIAKSSGIALDAAQRRSARKLAEKIPSGSGVWLQSEDGTWSQR